MKIEPWDALIDSTQAMQNSRNVTLTQIITKFQIDTTSYFFFVIASKEKN